MHYYCRIVTDGFYFNVSNPATSVHFLVRLRLCRIVTDDFYFNVSIPATGVRFCINTKFWYRWGWFVSTILLRQIFATLYHTVAGIEANICLNVSTGGYALRLVVDLVFVLVFLLLKRRNVCSTCIACMLLARNVF